MNSKKILNSMQMGVLILLLSACGKFEAKERPSTARPTSTSQTEDYPVPEKDQPTPPVPPKQQEQAQPQAQQQQQAQTPSQPQTQNQTTPEQKSETTPVQISETSPAQTYQAPQAQAPKTATPSQVTPTPAPAAQQPVPAAPSQKTEPRVVVPELPATPEELAVVKEYAPKATPTPSSEQTKNQPKKRVRPGMKTSAQPTPAPTPVPTPVPKPPARPSDLNSDVADKKPVEKQQEKPVEKQERPQPVRVTRPEPKPQQTTEVKTGALDASEIAERGEIKPTVYYFPVYDEEKGLCHPSEKQVLRDRKGKEIMKVCPKTLSDCGMQGSCAIVQDDETRSFNIHTRVAGVDRFFEIEDDGCRFGYGVKGFCLDPFYTLAADLDVYDPGDVIYIPEIAGTELPNGRKHNGLFIVRDRGRGIVGKGRFDFFTGFYGWKNTRNPFVKLRLADKNTRMTYYKLKGPRAEQFKQSRAFPKLPANAIDDMD